MKRIITRFAPSPTGYLHVGGARTALFNWLYARANNGKFILRIEDTDKERSTKESKDAILEGLNWLGIDWDEGPYFQSERFDIYKEYIEKLLDEKKAYYCTCSQERIDAVRKEAMEKGSKPKYDGKCRNLNLKKSENAVIRFKAPEFGETVLKDIVKGNIIFQNHELDDFIIARSDGSPTYNFVVVIDDITMGINSIIRGDDHVNNTPKQILLYEAIGADIPLFGHVPMVLGKDRARLSKRHGATSVTAYKDMGYLPEAMINYLVRLGWSYGDQEFFTKDDLIRKFTLKNLGKSAGIFDNDKLLSLNGEHIMKIEPEKTARYLVPFLEKEDIKKFSNDYITSIVKTLNKRSKTLVEMAEASIFYFKDDISFAGNDVKKFFKSEIKKPFEMLIERLDMLDDFSEKSLETVFLYVIEKTELKLGKIAQPIRLALTGKTASPGIFEIIEVLGKNKTIERLKRAYKMFD